MTPTQKRKLNQKIQDLIAVSNACFLLHCEPEPVQKKRKALVEYIESLVKESV